MSRIGVRPIKVKEGIKIEITPHKVVVFSNQKETELRIPEELTASFDKGNIYIKRKEESIKARSLHGLYARLIQNLLIGADGGFTKELEFKGTGYRVAVEGSNVLLNMGYSHEIKINIPTEITVTVKKNIISITGSDKQKVGNLASIIRAVRPPEVYKGKGIKYKDEFIKRKAGKKAAA